MNRLKKISAVIAVIYVCAFTMNGCGINSGKEASTAETEENTSSQAVSAENTADIKIESEYFTAEDLDTNCDDPDAEILFKGNSAEISGRGAEFADGRLSITRGGTYVLSGILTDGQVYVNTKEKVHIGLNGVDISCSDSAPVYIEDAGMAIVTLCGNTENKFTDSSEYVFENAEKNEPDAVIYSKDDLSVNGSGTLTVNANYNEGITSKNDLRISGVELNVKSAGNAVKGKDSLAFMNVSVNAVSMSDGLKSSNTEKEDKGYIAFESGEFSITAAQDAVHAETDIIVNGGNFDIKTGSSEKKENVSDSAVNSENNKQIFGRRGMMEGNSAKTDDSEKGLKAGRSVVLNGGKIIAECADDTLHSNGKIEINKCVLELSTGDDGIHAEEQIDINGGDINVGKAYEGIEAEVININDGTVNITASDDGFNASGGSGADTAESDSSERGGFKPGGFGDVSESCQININGGNVFVNADGDGLDSNGVININGGTVIVDGPVNDGNGALDSGTDIFINGGTLIAAGSSGMAEIPSETSKQYTVAACFEQSQEPDTPVCLKDADGKDIVIFKPLKTFSSVIISTPDIVKDKEYSIYYGGTVTGTDGHGYYADGSCTGGTLLGAEKASGSVTQIGSGKLGIMGGGMGHGFGGGIPDNMPEMPDGDNFPTPPEGFDKDMTPPEGFDGNMMPPDGFDGDMVPPGGFGNGMAPPDGGFGNGGMKHHPDDDTHDFGEHHKGRNADTNNDNNT